MNLGFFGILTLIFIVLKLIGTITWSWWLVLLPLYGGIAFVFLLLLFITATSSRGKL
jgi:hypothetical protein